jgi:hypothetical protein
MVLVPRYPDPQVGWQPFRGLITQLYRDEDRTLKEVMHIMQHEFGLKATYVASAPIIFHKADTQ